MILSESGHVIIELYNLTYQEHLVLNKTLRESHVCAEMKIAPSIFRIHVKELFAPAGWLWL